MMAKDRLAVGKARAAVNVRGENVMTKHRDLLTDVRIVKHFDRTELPLDGATLSLL
jgi:hypothetical protein